MACRNSSTLLADMDEIAENLMGKQPGGSQDQSETMNPMGNDAVGISGLGVGEASMNFKHDEDYKKKREKNNEAVRKSRQKTKRRTMETAHRVEKLKKVELCFCCFH